VEGRGDLEASRSPIAVAVRSGSKLWKVHSTPLPLAEAVMSNIPPFAKIGRFTRAAILCGGQQEGREGGG
jgi:hypothetical protein